MKFNQNIIINNSEISNNSMPYIVAEISANHNNCFDRCKQLVHQAKKCGANAVKFQTYTPDSLTLNSNASDFIIGEGLWENKSLYDAYEVGSLPYSWHEELLQLQEILVLEL